MGVTLPAASSAGGEQPKFLTETTAPDGGHQHLIVKFSPPRGTPFGERWHDLLHLEHLALAVLADNGVAVAPSRIVQSGERTYLVSERFDRVGMHGKRHVVPASAAHDAFVTAPLPTLVQPAGYAALAAQTRTWAITYWERAACLPALSPALRAASADNARRLQESNKT